jgi:dihydroorotate dehydrogenase electron transfer subunit
LSRLFSARITRNAPLNRNHNLLSLAPLTPLQQPLPGQFFMLGVEGDYDPLLKRPFCLLRSKGSEIEILYRIKGRGTTLLRNAGVGQVVEALGPLGNCYPLPEDGQIALVIAGGIGIASVFSLIEKLGKKVHVFYGARSADEFFFLDELKALAREVTLCTDDGSVGERGTVADSVGRFLDSALPGPSYRAYACGPRPLLAALSGPLKERGIEAYASLEENMACGIGACLGCVVKTVRGHLRVCKEGPVFRLDEIVWT